MSDNRHYLIILSINLGNAIMKMFSTGPIYLAFFLIILVGCSTSQKNEESELDDKKLELKKSLPSGMVDATILINRIYDKEDKTFSSAEIVHVHEYGQSVRALSENVIYEFEINSDVLKEINSEELFGKELRCRLLKLPGTMDRNAPDKFKVVSIEIK